MFGVSTRTGQERQQPIPFGVETPRKQIWTKYFFFLIRQDHKKYFESNDADDKMLVVAQGKMNRVCEALLKEWDCLDSPSTATLSRHS